MKIGFFDSGIGGLSVLYEAKRAMPRADFLYYADCDRAPYGEKTEMEVSAFVFEAVEFLLGQGAEAIVLACNTATSVAVAALRERYTVPIIGMEPAVKRAVDLAEGGRILVTGTPITLRGDKLRDLIGELDATHRVDLLPLPGLVKLAERGEFVSAAVTAYLEAELSSFNLDRYSFLVLGCTHFNYFKDTISALLPEGVRIVDGNGGTVRQLIRRIGGVPADGAGMTRYFISGREVTDGEELARLESYSARLAQLWEAEE